MKKYSNDQIKNKLQNSLKLLYTNEEYLLTQNANERSLTHKLAEYLQKEFPEYDVDCEYNIDIDSLSKRKKWISPKVRDKIIQKIEEIKNGLNPLNYDISEEIHKISNNFYPDIIIHKRKTNLHNLLVIEAKKNFDDDIDEEKLKAFTKSEKDIEGETIYNYNLGAKIIFSLTQTEMQNPVYFVEGERENLQIT